MCVHCELEAGPEEHGGAIDVGVYCRAFAALQLESEMLVETHAQKNAETVVGRVD